MRTADNTRVMPAEGTTAASQAVASAKPGVAAPTMYDVGFGTMHPGYLMAQRLARKPAAERAAAASSGAGLAACGGARLDGGRIGGAKGVGALAPHRTKDEKGQTSRIELGGLAPAIKQMKKKKKKALTPREAEEAKALAAREAARERVKSRTLASFGMK